MSGASITYNLRPNKFVERQLFVELLGMIDAGRSPDERLYISLGGPQLEDHRLVYRRLRVRNLFSLEEDPTVLKRQLFNRRPSYIECLLQSTGDFVRDFDAFADEHGDKSLIIWLDYTRPGERRQQLIEYQTLLSKLGAHDVLKITLNANAWTLLNRSQRSDESWDDYTKQRREALSEQLHDYLPDTLPAEITNKNETFTRILCSAVKIASLNATQNMPDLEPLPLALFVYQDGPHPMLTITTCLVLSEEIEQFRVGLQSLGWTYLPADWDDVTRISVPELTAKERLHIEGLLFSDQHETVHDKLPFRLDPSKRRSLAMLEEYARHCERYPSYFQVVL